MHYTLKQLRYLEASARLRSITAAAGELSISPSSIAAAIDSIEAELSETLFIRHPSKGITPTRFGLSFLENIRELLRAHIKFESSLPGIGEKIEGSIRLGCFTPVAPIILPLILKLVSQEHPTLSVQIIEGDAADMVELLNSDKIDLALTFSMNLPRGINFQGMFHAPPHIALSGDHPLASRSSLTLEDMVGDPLILLNLDVTRSYMIGLFEQRGLSPNILYLSRSSEMVRSLVAAGFGFAIFNVKPRSKQNYAVGNLVRIPLSTRHLEPEFGLIYHGKGRLSRVASAITEACQNLKESGAFRDFIVPPAVG